MSASTSTVGYEANLEELYEAGKKYMAQKKKQKKKQKEQQQQRKQGHEAQLPKQQPQQNQPQPQQQQPQQPQQKQKQQQHHRHQYHGKKRNLSEIGPEAAQTSLEKRPRLAPHGPPRPPPPYSKRGCGGSSSTHITSTTRKAPISSTSTVPKLEELRMVRRTCKPQWMGSLKSPRRATGTTKLAWWLLASPRSTEVPALAEWED
ncbi:hypothetical protein F4810DRAFT_666348 [Camillea tinctor]|nr:hypothetical protein F4810DRAFT_666348 [Camillea tinctor]